MQAVLQATLDGNSLLYTRSLILISWQYSALLDWLAKFSNDRQHVQATLWLTYCTFTVLQRQ